jgi:hypothetical protein
MLPPQPKGYELRVNVEEPQVHTEEYPASGPHWEAGTAASAIRDGQIEYYTMPLEESLLVMQVTDKMRKGSGSMHSGLLEDVKDAGPHSPA